MPSFDHTEIINGQEVPFKIYVERRKSVRVAFGRSSINVRIPAHLSSAAKEKHLQDAVHWVGKIVKKNPDALEPYKLKNYNEQSSFFIYGKEIFLTIKYYNRKSGKGSFLPSDSRIVLFIPSDLSGQEENKMIRQLLSRVCASIFKKDFEKRVHHINDQCFHKDIKSVNLKYNKSNWGSCSSATNLNFSTRLLFAPFDVIDYVIIHELAHLYEMNHSDRFWNIVQQVMPDYKEKELWLKKNGKNCDF